MIFPFFASSLPPFIIIYQASQEDVAKQKEMLGCELNCLREELHQIRDDRDRQLAQVRALSGEVEKYKEYTGKSSAQLDSLTIKTNALEVFFCFIFKLFSLLFCFLNWELV